MIIRQTQDSFIMIRQHDHAFLSGEIIKHFNTGLLKSDQHFEEMIYAGYQHDRSWIGLDDTPIWNDQDGIPYTFSDYPLLPKMAFYRIGLEEIERVSPYAALLCSMHFYSFFTKSKKTDCIAFMNEETKRQARLKKLFPRLDEELLQQHFRLLQFSDDMSLYMCLNEPGVTKEDEHPWFRDGFKNTEWFNGGDRLLNGEWLNDKEIRVDRFPFNEDFLLTLTFKVVSKTAIHEMGIAAAYEASNWEKKTFFIKK
ncbi:DUF3891 family protein [Bacillus sp. Marseille-Q1617]|uniref:DUF3891 family protein n=1 Tax=Bacillus sp. Marseille-Q1617 TaxID=2736887 RepID=UPI00158B04C6|nr:DUF3891 family protein [Bacillus sp. Marseille-Q1617]